MTNDYEALDARIRGAIDSFAPILLEAYSRDRGVDGAGLEITGYPEAEELDEWAVKSDELEWFGRPSDVDEDLCRTLILQLLMGADSYDDRRYREWLDAFLSDSEDDPEFRRSQIEDGPFSVCWTIHLMNRPDGGVRTVAWTD